MNQPTSTLIQNPDWIAQIQDPLKKKMPPILKGLMEKLLNLSELERLYRQIRSRSASQSFSESLLSLMGISYQISQEDLRRIPSTGPLFVVANHPFGALEGLVLASVLRSVRADVKILVNSILEPISELRELFIYVDNFGGPDATHYNFHPLRDAVRWLKGGGALAAFPAGEVAHIRLNRAAITDPPWKETIARLARKMGLPVLPVFFCGINSLAFQMLGLVHPKVRTALLARELLNKRDRSLEVRIGSLVSSQRLKDFGSDKDATEYLRTRTYLLEHRENMKVCSAGKTDALCPEAASAIPIAPPDDPGVLEAEIMGLEHKNILIDRGDILVVHADAWKIPNTLREIGRQREIAFRAAGEGSGKGLDLDLFDEHYQHIFLWNRERREIVGAYRIGRTDVILRKSGVDGLYVNTLFRLRRAFFRRLGPALELGRSFIRQENQRDTRSLPLLWAGIARYVASHPKYRYLYGPVSISSDYRPISRQLMAWFLRAKHPWNVGPFAVTPVRPPSFCGAEARAARLCGESAHSLDDLSDLISDIEPDSKGVPVLLRHYVRLGAKVLAFNVDPDFGNCLDALVVVDLAQVDAKILERLMGKSASYYFRLCHGINIIETSTATC